MNTLSNVVSAALFSTLALSVAACTDDTAPQQEDDAAAVEARKLASAPDGCESMFGIARPIAAPHFHAPDLKQIVGQFALKVSDTGVRNGSSLATIVGAKEDGTLLGNHDWLFGDAGFRTQNDTINLTPTDDPCKMNVDADVFIVEGSGAWAGLTGTVHGQGVVDFCGAPGRVEVTGYVCN